MGFGDAGESFSRAECWLHRRVQSVKIRQVERLLFAHFPV